MGILEELGGQGGIASIVQNNPQLLQAAASLLSSREGSLGGTGGLAGILQAFHAKGLGDIAQSWVSTGANKPVSAGQVSDVLGSNVVQDFAKQANVPVNEASGALAGLLPTLVNQLTPKGELPHASALEGALGSLVKSLVR